MRNIMFLLLLALIVLSAPAPAAARGSPPAFVADNTNISESEYWIAEAGCSVELALMIVQKYNGQLSTSSTTPVGGPTSSMDQTASVQPDDSLIAPVACDDTDAPEATAMTAVATETEVATSTRAWVGLLLGP